MKKVDLRNPKRNFNLKTGRASWYDYYAGYSTQFVEDIIKYINPVKNSIIFDPWNGSGTTTHIASKLGYKSIGYDINPVMIIVAKAKRIDYPSLQSLKNKTDSIINLAKAHRISDLEVLNDPLSAWLQPSSVIPFRQIETAFLIANNCSKKDLSSNNYEGISNLISFYYVALFKTVKELLSGFRSSNPTWIKRPKNNNEKININSIDVYNTFSFYVNQMIDAVNNAEEDSCGFGNSNISLASSVSLPLHDNSIDAVITSPPYCTRIDYAIATILELAILGYSDNKKLKTLRDKMIGTPTISRLIGEPHEMWGKSANNILELISKHESKASKLYYYKVYFQYFSSIYSSLEEINRVLKPNSYCVFVVQNSYYKDILVDLSKVFIDMTQQFSWVLDNKFAYKKNTIAGIHKNNNKYRKSSKVDETVLIFKKKN
ncbi:DNA methyltransferase [Calidifontibacillus oryziterrae]|uniref:DNA methyltransferase n=1 Tax=Calidifontibacillus oryziterrae TaxID=1191699 RepID=UPI00030E4C0F|nr:DNA methyltransferase [Calidifontibacillus oryziterrae]